ncbi:MAG TPA: hypothetical protein ENI34_07070 [candidate division WOR-3 bacterium]|uniref:OmpA-like domain-containing protein n=1 Tax=candidate division WOR-3 bacterium TaxID=2052148 RepID=A0A9C9EMI8_UNCW3|nr:hypothetical protein [candidate division WOR-3 bacterium]
MKKLLFIICALPLVLLAQEGSIYGGRGMFKLQYAQPYNMGVLSFHIAPQERFEEIETTQGGRNVVDRRHFFEVSTGLTYSIIDYIDMRFDITPFCKWFEMNNYPIDRGDPDPVIGIKSIKIGGKVGYPFIVEEMTPLLYAFGIDGYVDIGPGLSEEWFSNALEQDRRFYSDSFPEAGGDPYAPNFPPHIPHDPDICVTGLFDFRIGPFATHFNGGYLSTGPDKRPYYVDSTEFENRYVRSDYAPHGFGVELMPSEDVRILFETYGLFDLDAREESLWVTPGIRFGSRSVSFDIGCELGLVNPTSEDFWWKVFFNLSGGADLVKKVEVHIPIAKITGRIYDAKTNNPIAATITFPGSDQEAIQTSELGTYEVSLTPGSYRLHVEASGYRWQEKGIVLKDGDQLVLDFNLNRKPVTKIIGKVYDAETKLPLVAQITFPQTNINPISSDTAGMYHLTIAPGTYRIHVEATNYQFNEKVVTLKENETKVVDIGLTKIGVAQATLTGKVSEKETGKPLLAQLTFIDTEIPKVTTDPSTGIYKVTVKPGTYSVKVEAEDYVPESAPIVLAKDETKIQNFTLRPIPKVGEKVVLKGIYFDFNSAVIKPTSYPVLDDAAKVLKAKPKMRVEISGHTDSVGSDSYNQKLSYQRANAVRDYLIRYHNIDPSRLIAVGYGESQPIADNRTKAGRDLNRRIEFKILSWE